MKFACALSCVGIFEYLCSLNDCINVIIAYHNKMYCLAAGRRLLMPIKRALKFV